MRLLTDCCDRKQSINNGRNNRINTSLSDGAHCVCVFDTNFVFDVNSNIFIID